jgi:hypothetical protein
MFLDCSIEPDIENPAALKCPPPAYLEAIKETST